MFNKIRLLTPGPTPLPETVRLALARDMIHHRQKDFMEIMAETQKKLRILFGAKGPVLPLASSGTGAMTAAIYSLFNPGEKVLVVEGGKFGERWREIAESRGLEPIILPVAWGEGAEPQAVADMLDRHPDIKGLCVQLCETSTGVAHPVGDMAALTAGRDILCVVDGISGVGIQPCPMDEWRIDCLLTGSQKGLMLPPGLALIALSDRAWAKAEKVKPGCFYFNLPKERKALEKGQTNFTTPVNLIFGLEASLDLLLANGMADVFAKQWAMTMLVRTGLADMGLELFARKNFAWGVTSVLLPQGVDGQEVLKLASEKYGVRMAGGQDRLKGRIARIGHMGWVDWADCLAALYALERSISLAGGYIGSRDYLEAAMRAYNAALLGKSGEMPLH